LNLGSGTVAPRLLKPFVKNIRVEQLFSTIAIASTSRQGLPMTRSSDRKSPSQGFLLKNSPEDLAERLSAADVLRQDTTYAGMKLIPWGDVWKSLRTARFRGNGEMIEVFYDTLFKEAVFDDRGAWSLERRMLH
jgi:hypothetical protein